MEFGRRNGPERMRISCILLHLHVFLAARSVQVFIFGVDFINYTCKDTLRLSYTNITKKVMGFPNYVPITVFSTVTFEDKKRENFERGNLELEKRRQALLEQQRKEQERLATLEREEQERKERERQEQERRRQQELEKQLEKQRELERQREEERRKEIERREVSSGYHV